MAFNKGLPKTAKVQKAIAERTTVIDEPVHDVLAGADEELSAPITDEDLLPPSAPPSTGTNKPVETLKSGAISMSANDIADIVRAAVEAARHSSQSEASANNSAIAEAISSALAQHMGPPRMTAAQMGEPKTPFNPHGKKRELKCDFYQNYAPIHERFVSDDEIEMLHQLVPGIYGPEDFRITVVQVKRLNGKHRIYVNHPDGKSDRLRLKNYAPNFHLMLVKLVQEAKEQKAQRKAEARALLAED